MLLIDVGKLVRVEATANGGLIISRKDFQNGFQVIQGPIKVKLDKDILVVISPAQDDTGAPRLAYSILKSTQRKFKDDYVRDVLRSKVVSRDTHVVTFDAAAFQFA